MKYYSLASGSKGNCFVVQTKESIVVIDCGSTKKHLINSFTKIDINYTQVDALLITHGHIDHVSQVKMFANIPIFSPAPFNNGLGYQQVVPFMSFNINELSITPIPLSHDSEITVGYVIEDALEKLVYITDTGYIKNTLISMLKDAQYIVLESNHDPEMLMNSRRPHGIKTRILSDNGHLSNEACAEVLRKIVSLKTKEIILAHLSDEANSSVLAYKTTYDLLVSLGYFPELKIASQFEIVTGGSIS
ncbi:MAG: MBL fold metallo-hydrolase [Firmicutes bacterium HGW-Firmicutes-19]|jgi:phosphoribosyl 1,2-cyclic phosphodiesterase|nr:MAG: MBL fold metallo-hydrolase [Firmicutes bacterium HGW-Firmicutes-19]